MTLLLDTHTLLWFLRDDPSLSRVAKTWIIDPANHKLVSVASCWEIAIKAGLRKLTLTEPSGVLLARELPRNGFGLLEIRLSHATGVEQLPPCHKDPFDRLLVSQCLAESLSIISADEVFDQYGVVRIW